MTPQPKPSQTPKKNPKPKSGKTSNFKIGLVIFGLLGAVLVGGTILSQLSYNYYHTLTPPDATAGAGSGHLTTIAKVDTLMMGEEAERKKSANDLIKDGLNAPILPLNQAVDAINQSTTIPKDKKPEVIANLTAGKNKLTEITVWDDVAEDGDVVSLSTAGVRQEVPILHQPTKVFLPLVAGQPVVLTGVKDGGGGITVAIGNGNTPLANPVLQEGESLSIPVK